MGAIVVISGPSSSGKTTVARATAARLGPTAAVVSVDDLYPLVHRDVPDRFAVLTDAVFAVAASLCERGLVALVDTVFDPPELLDRARTRLDAHPVCWVTLDCSLDVLQARERSRGNRRIGLAAAQNARAPIANLHLDTSRLSIDECADRILGLMSAQ